MEVDLDTLEVYPIGSDDSIGNLGDAIKETQSNNKSQGSHRGRNKGAKRTKW